MADQPQSETRFLWVAPMLNHYKAEVLARLAERPRVDLRVLVGRDVNQQGHVAGQHVSPGFQTWRTTASYWNFGRSPRALVDMFRAIRRMRPHVVLVPAEKKFIAFVVWTALLKLFYRFRLITLNHPICGKDKSDLKSWNVRLTRIFYGFFDRVGFYTEAAREWAVGHKIVARRKSFFANNTLDTQQIWNDFPFEICENPQKTLLFIGRLVQSKRVAQLLEIYGQFCQLEPDAKLKIIGAGPLEEELRRQSEHLPNVEWLGAVSDQRQIGAHMRDSHVVVIPGASGLSIVHAFCYGKPYVTLDHASIPHGPEITYLRHDENGLFLDGDSGEVATALSRLLNDSNKYTAMCEAAFASAQSVSIDHWCENMEAALTN